MLKKILLAVLILIACVLLYAATRPDSMHIERTAVVNAPPEKIFPHINDFKQWTAWSPFEKLDPDMKKTYSGAERGRGAVYEWAGNSQAGQGRMEITDSVEPSRVRIKLDFIAPFEGHNVAEFKLAPQGNATAVTWTMDGPSSYIAKIMGIFVNMDTMIGSEFDSGLATLKAIAEK